MRRTLFLSILLTVSLGAFTACAKKKKSDDPPAPQPTPEPTVAPVTPTTVTTPVTPTTTTTPTATTATPTTEQLQQEYNNLPVGLMSRVPTDEYGNDLSDQAEARIFNTSTEPTDFSSANGIWGQGQAVASSDAFIEDETNGSWSNSDTNGYYGDYSGYGYDPYNSNSNGAYNDTSSYYNDAASYNNDMYSNSGLSYGYRSRITSGAYWRYSSPSSFYDEANHFRYYFFRRPQFSGGFISTTVMQQGTGICSEVAQVSQSMCM